MGRETLPLASAIDHIHEDRQEAEHGAYSAPMRDLDQAKLDEKLIRVFKNMRRLKGVKQDAEPRKIASGLFIGSIGAAQNLDGLRAAGITHILNASPLVPCFYRGKFNYLAVDVYDESTEDITKHFLRTNSFIQEGVRKGGVLIHCYAGISRSAAFALAFMVAHMQLELAKAFKLLRHARPTAQPNSGFMMQLEAYSKNCRCGQQSRAYLLGLIEIQSGTNDVICATAALDRPQ